MGPLQGERVLLGGPDYGFRKILANGAGQKKIRNLNKTPVFFTRVRDFVGFKSVYESF